MRGYYQDAAALDSLIASGNPVHYEVFEYPVPNEYGHLMFCISDLKSGCIGDECFMTKGHYHERINTGETYLALRGGGYMMMQSGAR